MHRGGCDYPASSLRRDVLKTCFDSSTRGVAQWDCAETCLKAQLHSGELLLLIAGSIPLLGSHLGCSYLLLMLLMLLLGMRDPISRALCCLHWRQCYNSHWSQQQQKQQPQPFTSECSTAKEGCSQGVQLSLRGFLKILPQHEVGEAAGNTTKTLYSRVFYCWIT